jgi:pyridoxamine 5'-phosphate oxidase
LNENFPRFADSTSSELICQPLAPWRTALTKAIHSNRKLPSARYPQLATLGLDGRPANRTVVFRGFFANTNDLQFITDARSTKADQIAHQPAAELCWYFAQTREQFRIAGDLYLVGANHPHPDLQASRVQLWQQLSDAARLQFTWPSPGDSRQDHQPFPTDVPNRDEPLATFCLLLLEPRGVDHLMLRGTPQNRHRYQRLEGGSEGTDAWQCQSVNP